MSYVITRFTREKLLQIVFILLMLFPILKNGIITTLIIIAYLLSFFQPNFSFNSIIKKDSKPHIYIYMFFAIMCVSLIYSNNLSSGFNEVKKAVHLALIPLLLFLNQKSIDFKTIELGKKTFILSSLILSSYVLFFAFYYINRLYGYLTFFEVFREVVVNDYSGVLAKINVKGVRPYINLHEVYISVQLLVSILFSFNFLNSLTKSIDKIMTILIIIFFCITILILGSKVNILLLGLIFICYLSKKVFSKTKLGDGMIKIILLLIPVLIISFQCFGVYQEKNISSAKLKNTFEFLGIGFNERAISNDCGTSIISENYFFGIGVGDVQDNLNSCYLYKKQNAERVNTSRYENVNNFKFNSHNYFFFSFLFGGVLSILSLLLFLRKSLLISLKRRQYNYMLFLIIIIVNLFFENYLVRIQGILTFSLINMLFFFSLWDKKEERI